MQLPLQFLKLLVIATGLRSKPKQCKQYITTFQLQPLSPHTCRQRREQKKWCYWQFMHMKTKNENQDIWASFYSVLHHWACQHRCLPLSMHAGLRLHLDLDDFKIQPCSGKCMLSKFSSHLESEKFVWMLCKELFHVQIALLLALQSKKCIGKPESICHWTRNVVIDFNNFNLFSLSLRHS